MPCRRRPTTTLQCWAHIGPLVYGISEGRLPGLSGRPADNPRLNLSCREVFAGGQKNLRVAEPFAEVDEVIVTWHRWFWTQW